VVVHDLKSGQPLFVLDPALEEGSASRQSMTVGPPSPSGDRSPQATAFLGHRLSRDVKFSKDGARIFATYLAGSGVVVWDVARRRKVESFTAGTGAMRLALTGDGQRLAILTETQDLLVWDTKTLRPTDFSPAWSNVHGTTFSGYIACGERGHLL